MVVRPEMPNHEFENYLALVSRLMRLNRSQTESIRQELSDHLETRVFELVESGVDVVGATRRALEEFGDAAVLAKEFQGIFQLTRRRWMMRFATFSIAATFLAAVLIMAMWPSAARFGAPSSSIAQDDSNANADDEGDQTGAFQIGSLDFVVTNTQPEHRPMRPIMSSEDVDRKLQQPADFDFVDTPLVEIMQMIRDMHGFNVLLDDSALVDLDENSLITFKIRDARLSTALRLILNKHNTTYVVQDGILLLISLDVSGDPEFFRRKIFDCRELLVSIRKAERDRIGTPIGFKPPVNRIGSNGRGGGVFNLVPSLSSSSSTESPADGLAYSAARQGEGRSMRPDHATAESMPSESTPAEGAEELSQLSSADQLIIQRVTAESILIDLVKTSVDPESWDTTNGDGTLTIVGGFMVVTQTQATLDEIANLIGELETRMK